MMTDSTTFDYIIAGGGTAGCVLASRLSQYLPDSSIALVEVGPDAHDDPNVVSALGAPSLHGTTLQWNDMTAPQRGANNRQIYHGGGKLLSGGSAVNYATWVRGHEVDFDEWAKLVGDERWSYKSLRPCFQRTETHYQAKEECTNPDEHGFDGPIHTQQSFEYPLGPTILEALRQAGHKVVADANSGQPLGVARWVSNWRDIGGTFVRQPAGQAYDLSKVHIITSALIHKILIENIDNQPKAVGIDIGNGDRLMASKEVIVCCGALRTPQLLMLSGIGSASYLEGLGIDPVVDLPDVGGNLHDHAPAMLFWKLKHPEKALSIGHPDFDTHGVAPSEWLLTGTVPSEPLFKALQRDGVANPSSHPNLVEPRAHYEMTFGYFPAGAQPGVLPTDGSIITTGVCNFLPTARGSVALRSVKPEDPPVIDPAYLTTDHDLCILREAMRELMRIMRTPAAKTEVEGLFQLPGPPIDLDSTDKQLNEWLRQHMICWFHPAGTAAMGKVVDGSCNVKGVKSLRVVDASILPIPLAAHYQAPVYAMAEKAAEIIAGLA